MALVSGEHGVTWKDRIAFNMAKIKSIRVFVFIAILVVSIAPMAAILLQAQKTAFEREIQQVDHAHLVIADNLASTLERYAQDITSAFNFLVEARGTISPDAWEVKKLTDHYGFRFIALANKEGRISAISAGDITPTPSQALLQELRREVVQGKTVLSGVKLLHGTPYLFAIRSLQGGKIAFGAFDTKYLQRVQKAIAFGEKGHSMIVDNNGRVLAHPNPNWQATAKDASGLEVVQKMITGNTGVMQFYAPPLKADVIAGYTYVPSTGWGVMVPQPIAELEAVAQSEIKETFTLLVVLVALAAFGGWILSGLITKPMRLIKDTVGQIRDGDLGARVPEFPSPVANELENCRLVFNGLMDKLSSDAELMKRSLDAAEEANRTKSRFIAVLSHEMRTPLNGIVATLELLSDAEMTAEQREYYRLLEISSASLKRHVDDVLDINRLNHGKARFEVRELSISQLIKRVVRENEANARKLDNTIELSISPALPETVRSDPKMLDKIISNLVSNAVKYTHAGEISVTADLSECGSLLLTVQDSGIGIPEDDLERIFQPFTTLNSAYARSRDGTGLGLSIAKGFIEAVGGEIVAESVEGEGSIFQVVIPFETAETPGKKGPTAPPAPNEAVERQTFTGHVLVVDDNHVNTIVLSKMLLQMGLEVSTAAGGFEALEIVKNQTYDLILMDISMPGMDGAEVSRIIRNNSGPNQKTPIVAQTAHAMPAEREAFADAGMQAILIKPITRNDLTNLLSRHSASNDLKTQTEIEAPEAGIALDDAKFAEVVELVGADDAGALVVSLNNGVCDLIEKLKTDWAIRRDGEDIAALAHKLAGACAVLGAVSLRRKLTAIQNGAKDGSLRRVATVVKELSGEMEQTDAKLTSALAKIFGLASS